MPTATITSKGRVTIPRKVRTALGLAAGDRISFILRGDGVVEIRPEKADLMSLCGILKPTVRGVTLEDMEEAGVAMIHVVDARHVSGFTLWLRFNDGTEGEIDLSGELEGPIFQPLRDPLYFKTFKVDLDTVTWPNGADFAPEFLYSRLRVRA